MSPWNTVTWGAAVRGGIPILTAPRLNHYDPSDLFPQDLSVLHVRRLLRSNLWDPESMTKAQTQASYEARSNRVTDYLYEHLDEDIRPRP